MKKMRKIMALALAGVTVLSLAGGCTSQDAAGPIELKIGVSTGESDPRNIAAQAFADEIEAAAEL